MGTITLTNPTPSSIIDATLFAQNYSFIQNLINGHLDDANIGSIDATKVLGTPFKFYDQAQSGASVTISGIPQTYTHMMMMVAAKSTAAPTSNILGMTFNGAPLGSSYVSEYLDNTATSLTASGALLATSGAVGLIPGNTANDFGGTLIWIPDYTNTTNKKMAVCMSSNVNASIRENNLLVFQASALLDPITSIVLQTTTAIGSGSRFSLYLL